MEQFAGSQTSSPPPSRETVPLGPSEFRDALLASEIQLAWTASLQNNTNACYVFCQASVFRECFLVKYNNVPVAQLDRAPVFGTGGCRFNSCREHRLVIYFGRVAEWTNAPVLKTGSLRGLVGSNPTPSARLARKRKRKGKPPKNLKKCRLKLYFGQKQAFLHFLFV